MSKRARNNFKRAAFGVLIAAVFSAQAFFPVFVAHAVVPVESGSGLARKITAVATLVQNIAQTATQFALKLKEFVGDALANALAKAALRSITQSTVNWINSGFKGSPSFVTNPEGFLTDVADQVIGAAIEDAAPLLCSPFQLDIRLALGLNYSFGSSREIRCRLTDVISNLQGSYEGFVAGDFRQGGWDRFINISSVPQNNPYGAYLATQDYLGIRVVSATAGEMKRLEFGRGFLDFRECEVPGDTIPIPNSNPPRTRQGPCKKKGPVKTPGSVIEGQLQSTLGVDLSSLALADEINEIFAALINQLTKKIFTRGGLASASSYNSTFDTGVPVVSGPIRAGDLAAVNAKAAQLGDIEKQKAGAGDAGVAFGSTLANPAAGTTEKERIDAQAKIDAEKLGASGAGNVVGADQNLAGSDNGIPKTVRQSSIFAWGRDRKGRGCQVAGDITYYGPEKAVDGNTDGTHRSEDNRQCSFPNSYIRTLSETNQWWEVDLGQSYAIGKVSVFPRKDGSPISTYLGTTYIFVSNAPYSVGQASAQQFPADGVLITLPSTIPEPSLDIELADKNKEGRYLRIQRQGLGELSFAEVQVFQNPLKRKAVPQFTNLTANLDGVRQTTKSVVPATDSRWQTTQPEFASSKGVDGNTNGNIYDPYAKSLVGLVSPVGGGFDSYRTGIINYPWWQVDLGGSKTISEIKIWRRTDVTAAATLPATYLFVTDLSYDGLATPDWSRGFLVPVPSSGAGEPRPITITVPQNTKGRYVRIQRNVVNDNLWFSELQVFEQPTQAQPSGGSVPPAQTIFISISPQEVRWFEPSTPPSYQQHYEYKQNGVPITETFSIKNTGTQPVALFASTAITEEATAKAFSERLLSLTINAVGAVNKSLLDYTWSCTYSYRQLSSCQSTDSKDTGAAFATKEVSKSFTLQSGETATVTVTLRARFDHNPRVGYSQTFLTANKSVFKTTIKSQNQHGQTLGAYELRFGTE